MYLFMRLRIAVIYRLCVSLRQTFIYANGPISMYIIVFMEPPIHIEVINFFFQGL